MFSGDGVHSRPNWCEEGERGGMAGTLIHLSCSWDAMVDNTASLTSAPSSSKLTCTTGWVGSCSAVS